MSDRGRLSRPAAAKAKTAERRLAVAAAKRRATASQRQGTGPLRDRQVRPATLERYKMAMEAFFIWAAWIGLVVPDSSDEFDALL